MVGAADEASTADRPPSTLHDEASKRQRNNNAATGASAAGIRALSSQLIAFYFRAPIKAFFRTRVDYMGYAKAINPRIQAQERWSLSTTTPGILVHAVREHGWRFIPQQVLPPMLANMTVGAVLYTSYLTILGLEHHPAAQATARMYPPPPISATFTAGAAAGGIQSLVAAPLDALQIRFKTSDMLEGQYKHILHYSKEKLREIGYRGVFAGWTLSFLRDSLGAGLFFATFETIKSQAFYSFVTTFYGSRNPVRVERAIAKSPLERHNDRPTIRPHYTIEPAFILGAGIAASVAQQLVQHPIQAIQDVHYGRLELLDYAAKLQQSRSQLLRVYYRAYEKTFEQCQKQAARAGGWRAWLFRDFFRSTLRQVPSTSAGLIVFELVRRRYATEDDVVRIEKDGYDILLS